AGLTGGHGGGGVYRREGAEREGDERPTATPRRHPKALKGETLMNLYAVGQLKITQRAGYQRHAAPPAHIRGPPPANGFAPAHRLSAETSGSFTARASTIAPTIPLIVASAFSRRAAAERPVTNVVRTSMKSRRPLVKVARTGAGWRTASAARQAIAQPRP